MQLEPKLNKIKGRIVYETENAICFQSKTNILQFGSFAELFQADCCLAWLKPGFLVDVDFGQDKNLEESYKAGWCTLPFSPSSSTGHAWQPVTWSFW